MVKLGGKYLKTAETEDGDMIVFKDPGSWVETKWTYDDGTPKSAFQISIDHKGEEKTMNLNATNREVLKSVYGDETELWVGKSATITKVKAMIAGVMKDCIVLEVKPADAVPKSETPWDE